MPAAVADRTASREAIRQRRLVRLNRADIGIHENVWLITPKRHRLNALTQYLMQHFRISGD